MLNSRFFNQITVDANKTTLEKRSQNIDKFIGEISWYLEIPQGLKHYIPQILDYSLDREDAFLKMEYCGHQNLGDS